MSRAEFSEDSVLLRPVFQIPFTAAFVTYWTVNAYTNIESKKKGLPKYDHGEASVRALRECHKTA